MNEEKSPQPQTEQLLKMIEMQIAASRERRAVKESGRSKAGLIGLVVIMIGAAVPLWMLMEMLEQMRQQRLEQPEQPAAATLGAK